MSALRRKLTVAIDEDRPQMGERVDLVEIRVLYTTILGTRYLPDRDVIDQAVVDMETAFDVLVAGLDASSLHPVLRPRYQEAAGKGRALIKAMQATKYADIRPAGERDRRMIDDAFRYAYAMAEQVKTLAEVLAEIVEASRQS